MGDLIKISIYFIIIGTLLFIVVKNLMEFLFSLDKYSVHNRRATQLKREVAKGNATTYETIERLTQPVVDSLFPKIGKWLPSLNTANLDQLRKELALIKWDDTFSPESFIATGLVLKIVSIPALLFSLFFLSGGQRFIGLAITLALFMGLDFMMRGEIKSLRVKLFSDFPDFIRIVSGYLSADIPLVQAIQDSIQYVGEVWKPVLQQFVVDCDTQNVATALDSLKQAIDIFEVKEFVSLVKLTLEQGGDVKDGFLQQAEKIQQMQKNALYIKIGQRKTMSTMLQMPLLLLNAGAMMVPTIFDMVQAF